MRAAVLEEFDAPLHIRQMADPTPGPGEVVVPTRAAGICRTDLRVVAGAIPTVKIPLVLGHELAGDVVGVGRDTAGVEEGARVAVSLDISCGVCRYCRAGELDHCSNLRRLGMERDGALADLVRVPAANLIPVPDSMPYELAAMIPDAVGAPYHAVRRRADVRPAQVVAVWGLGGLGLSTVQIAAICGAEVIAIARTPDRRELAQELGATWTIDPNVAPVSEQIRMLTGGLGVHAFFDLVGIEGSGHEAVLSSRKGGKVVVIGYVAPEVRTTTMRLVYDEVTIMGSRGTTRADLLEAVELVARGRIRPIVGHELELEAVNDGLDLLRAGSVIGRAVVRFP